MLTYRLSCATLDSAVRAGPIAILGPFSMLSWLNSVEQTQARVPLTKERATPARGVLFLRLKLANTDLYVGFLYNHSVAPPSAFHWRSAGN